MSIDTKNLDNAIAALEAASSGGSRVNELMAKGAGAMNAQERAELAALLAAPTDATTAGAVGAVSTATEPFAKSVGKAGESVDATAFIVGIQHGVENAMKIFGEGLAKSQAGQSDTIGALAAGIKVLIHQNKALTNEVQALTKSVTALEQVPVGGPQAARPTGAGQLQKSFTSPGDKKPEVLSKAQVKGEVEKLIKSGQASAVDIAAIETGGINNLRPSVRALIEAQLSPAS